MRARVVDNREETAAEVLASAMQRASDTRIAVAFVSRDGLSLIERAIQDALLGGGVLEFLVGLDFQGTEPEALAFLFRKSAEYPGLKLYCLASPRRASIYHPKLYLLKEGEQVTSLIGSSNLTVGGLRRNVEANLLLEAGVRDEVVSDLYGTYSELKFHLKRVAPDEEFLTLYEELWKRNRRGRTADPVSMELSRRIEAKAETLPSPRAERRDLVGWLELVYETLPEGEFTNGEIYAHAEAFARRYPGNRNIRAKIRQQLQVLRDMGFIEHLGRARWRKL